MPLRVQKTPDPPGAVPHGDGKGRAVGVDAGTVDPALPHVRPPWPPADALAGNAAYPLQQQWFSFSDRQMEDALYEIESVRRFVGFVGVTDALPDETTILNFRHFLEDNGLTAVLLNTIPPQGTRPAGVQRHDGGCHHRPCPQLHQEPGQSPRS